MVKTLSKKIGKMYFALDSCREGWFNILVYHLTSNIIPLRYLHVL